MIQILILALALALQPVECTTDTECMALCDPTDSQCDGGPQS